MKNPAKVPRPKKPDSKTPERVIRIMKKNGLSKIWEVRRTPSRKDDKAFVGMFQKSDGSYKLTRFGSIASEKVRFNSRERMRAFRSRHACDTNPPKIGTARWASCEILWNPKDKLKNVKNCSNCKK